ncbi:helix-turn-helix domain-containing protein [Staphylococcus pettenkoferi]|uniref:helix-turn-helix domain-containing protein n=1 Tax=Staphylococcus pettenkoferi TaxID=170573 RepID=UPI0022758A9C|nr:XRE family transcriptional regulator [Staphylococcus pettenkoferi]MCY1604479.1 XRE family transcriptional regulator [Staphylococcus pettenkoferi]
MEEIGYMIRQFRQLRQMTLKQLSIQTGLSTSFLSQVERGTSSIAITSLSNIANALDVDITSFFKHRLETQFHIHPDYVESFKINHSHQEFKRVSSDFPNRKLENFIITIYPGDCSERSRHEGEEIHYLIQGELTFYLDQHKHVIQEGDIFHFPSKLSHYYVNDTDEPAVALSVVTPAIF